MHLYIPYRCNTQQPDALQQINSETEMCMCKYGVSEVLLKVLGGCFH